MAILKCKMCGGDLHFEQGASICECEYCGNTNTLPVVDTDQEMNLFNRANHFRMINEFDRAISAYEKILDSDDTNAEAHWGIVLSRYGIEYVEDPVSHKRIPTCHRVQMTSILSDPDYLAAVEHADSIASAEYKSQAEEIARIQKGILTISSKEKPYDVFICYKESEENGRRTIDSTLAQDIYYGLTESGYRVFFSRITLEDKLGQEYEPYIFAALNSAKVMLVIGTKPEYFNAVWVKNEWSRYLDLMKNDRHRLLIPCYRDMDPYDLPDELSMLQSQDMAKIGFMQDLLRGIRKVLEKKEEKAPASQGSSGQPAVLGTNVSAQIKRGNMALEDKEWAKADAFFEEALNLDPECAEAYLGKLLAKARLANWDSLVQLYIYQYEKDTSETLEACPEDTEHIEEIVSKYSLNGYVNSLDVRKVYDYDRTYQSVLSCRIAQKKNQEEDLSKNRLLHRARQYAGEKTKQQIEKGLASISDVLNQRIEEAREEDEKSISRVKADYAEHLILADKKAEDIYAAGLAKREQHYQELKESIASAKYITTLNKAKAELEILNDYKDSRDLLEKCEARIKSIEEEKRQKEREQALLEREEYERAERKRIIIRRIITGIIIVAVVIWIVALAMNEISKSTAVKRTQAAVEEVNLQDRSDCNLLESYMQDYNTSNGTEDIRGIVLNNIEIG